ncbi:hypothetical protein DVT68_16600 [Dyella solisilvae]|uniref:Uncharacterized protein n=1 Tax=Dyella solisilvae TaxID=1920168 RepID=A0A370K3Y8_9GAMM|nr:hypothetical protein [Dyella solisilvae]RDI97375.1 hypothetical protein DVT68_16600 [Dyella solisilvae]
MSINHPAAPVPGSPWYRQPILWLGVAIFAASLAGCVWMIVLGARYADKPLATQHPVFGVPSSSHSSAPR